MISLATPRDVVAFQRLRCGPDGRPLKQSGVIDAHTRWALDLDALPGWRIDIVLAALKWVGLVELATNSGPEIDVWLAACQCKPGDPWCAAFASMALRAGGIECREASVKRLAAKFVEVLVPLPGDLCCLHRPDGTGHVDIVTGTGVDFVSVVGGNVGNAVRAGLRHRAGRRFYRVGPNGIPAADESMPVLGIETR